MGLGEQVYLFNEAIKADGKGMMLAERNGVKVRVRSAIDGRLDFDESERSKPAYTRSRVERRVSPHSESGMGGDVRGVTS